MCGACGQPLDAPEGAQVFPCLSCGRVFEVRADEFVEAGAQTAVPTTELVVPPDVWYLAFWRFLATAEVDGKRSSSGAAPDHAWEQIRRAAAPEPPFMYVPAFTLSRGLVQQFGVGMVQAQPRLELCDGLAQTAPTGPRGIRAPKSEVVHGMPAGEAWAFDPGERLVSPVLLSRRDAEVVAHFVYLGLESRSTPGLRSIDYELGLTGGELLFLPASFDTRYVRDAGWRLLLKEFDGLVA